MDNIQSSLLNNLQKWFSPGEKVLLGLSGGCDSLALFHLLLQNQTQFPLSLAIAHVDHGWRKESTSEAKILEKLVHSHGLAFHLMKLSPELNNSNLEAKCREKRLAFFEKLCKENGYRGVLLAHHRDDQTETILKNILEGTNLFAQKGIRSQTQIGSLSIWRPLLEIPKAQLAQYLESKGATAFIDETNLDPRFLRGRMRTAILPHLQALFGKQIESNLISFQKEQEELVRFMEERHATILDSIDAGPFGRCLDLSLSPTLSTFDLKFLVRAFCKGANMIPSKQSIEDLATAWQKGSTNKQFPLGNQILHLDRKRIFLVPSPNLYCWELEFSSDSNKSTNWQGFSHGTFYAELPADRGPYRLGLTKMNFPYANRSEIGKWWNAHKIPAFLRQTVPVLWIENQIVHEFLTGKASPLWQREPCAKKISVILRIRETCVSVIHNRGYING